MKVHVTAAILAAAMSVSAAGETITNRTHEIIGFATFDFNSAAITTVEKSTIDYWMAKVDIPYDAKITLTGHTDLVGGEQYNYTLGLNRARTVADYMNQYKHKDAPTITVNSKGKTQPIWWTKDPVRINRRVDLKATWVEVE